MQDVNMKKTNIMLQHWKIGQMHTHVKYAVLAWIENNGCWLFDVHHVPQQLREHVFSWGFCIYQQKALLLQHCKSHLESITKFVFCSCW